MLSQQAPGLRSGASTPAASGQRHSTRASHRDEEEQRKTSHVRRRRGRDGGNRRKRSSAASRKYEIFMKSSRRFLPVRITKSRSAVGSATSYLIIYPNTDHRPTLGAFLTYSASGIRQSKPIGLYKYCCSSSKNQQYGPDILCIFIAP